MSAQSKLNVKGTEKKKKKKTHPEQKHLFLGLQKLRVRNKEFSKISAKVYWGRGLENKFRELSHSALNSQGVSLHSKP